MSSLNGKRILVTRTRQQASELASGLEAHGAVPIIIPTIEIIHPSSLPALDSALACLGTYDWLIFTSANAVEAFHRRAQFFRLSQLPHRIAVIGPATLKAANAIGLPVDLIPAQSTAECLAAALAPEASGRSFLLIRAAEARDVLPHALSEAGAVVTIAEAYRNELPKDSIAAIKALFDASSPLPDAVTFTSGSTAKNLASLLEAAERTIPSGIVMASIGPITSGVMRDLGWEPTIEAATASIPSLIESLAEHFGNHA